MLQWSLRSLEICEILWRCRFVDIWLVVTGTCYIFPYIGNNHPNWLSYVSEWFCQPPTRYVVAQCSKWFIVLFHCDITVIVCVSNNCYCAVIHGIWAHWDMFRHLQTSRWREITSEPASRWSPALKPLRSPGPPGGLGGFQGLLGRAARDWSWRKDTNNDWKCTLMIY